MLSNALEEFGIAEEAGLHADDPVGDLLLGAPVSQAIEPVAKRGRLAHFDHV